MSLKNFDTKEIKKFDSDELIFLFGLNKKLGPILEWEIDLDGKKITVNTENFQTSKDGIFAVGDINHYRTRVTVDSGCAEKISVKGQQVHNFCSNDYLGLADNKTIANAFKQGIETYGVGSGASHLISGHSKAHHEQSFAQQRQPAEQQQ